MGGKADVGSVMALVLFVLVIGLWLRSAWPMVTGAFSKNAPQYRPSIVTYYYTDHPDYMSLAERVQAKAKAGGNKTGFPVYAP